MHFDHSPICTHSYMTKVYLSHYSYIYLYKIYRYIDRIASSTHGTDATTPRTPRLSKMKNIVHKHCDAMQQQQQLYGAMCIQKQKRNENRECYFYCVSVYVRIVDSYNNNISR